MLKNEDFLKRYFSQLVLEDMDLEMQEALLNKTIVVIGCGGLGSPLATYLAGAGVGNITLIDPDIVELKNLHRQVFYTEDDINRDKVSVLAKHLNSLNHSCQVKTFKNKSWDVEESHFHADLVIDCADNFRTTYSLNSICVNECIPFLTASVSGTAGQTVLYRNLKSEHCCHCCIFPPDGELDGNECAEVGVLGPTVSMVAAMQSSIALDFLLGRDRHSEILYRFNANDLSTKKNKIKSDNSCKLK